jgi:predicted dehydrogenase
MTPVRVGIVGAGAISAQYLQTITALSALSLVAVADLDMARARRATAAYPVARALSVPELVSDPDVDLVVNLTIPAAHAEVALAAIAAGKSVYNEKPLASTTADARRVLTAAAQAGVRVGAAPDTVLGTGIQTARAAIDDGLIGRPVAATATFMCPGHERWHPDPDFYYAPGGGPLFDMGPYYISALVTMLGPIVSVLGASSRSGPVRTIGSGPRTGEHVPVDVETHVTAILRHANGALTTLVTSFDTVATKAVPIEVHGTSGSLVVPDPNRFDGDVRLTGIAKPGVWTTLAAGAGYEKGGRGLGVADMAVTPPGREPRAGSALAYHVLEVFESVLRSARDGHAVELDPRLERPPLVPLTVEPRLPAGLN